MNPAILGALIGAIPGTLAAGLATWASVRSSGISLQQTRITLAANHDRWLLEKRADVYLDLLQFTQDAKRRRFVTLEPKEITDKVRNAIQAGIDIYTAPETQLLVARTFAYVSSDTSR